MVFPPNERSAIIVFRAQLETNPIAVIIIGQQLYSEMIVAKISLRKHRLINKIELRREEERRALDTSTTYSGR